jgi:hypothetical protein
VRLGEILLHDRLVDEATVSRAAELQASVGARIGTVLIEMRAVHPDAVADALARQKGVTAARRRHFEDIDKSLLRLIPAHWAERHFAIPLGMGARFGRELVVAFRDPDNIIAVDEISFAAGARVRPSVAPEFYIIHYLEALYDVIPRRPLRISLPGPREAATLLGAPAPSVQPEPAPGPDSTPAPARTGAPPKTRHIGVVPPPPAQPAKTPPPSRAAGPARSEPPVRTQTEPTDSPRPAPDSPRPAAAADVSDGVPQPARESKTRSVSMAWELPKIAAQLGMETGSPGLSVKITQDPGASGGSRPGPRPPTAPSPYGPRPGAARTNVDPRDRAGPVMPPSPPTLDETWEVEEPEWSPALAPQPAPRPAEPSPRPAGPAAADSPAAADRPAAAEPSPRPAGPAAADSPAAADKPAPSARGPAPASKGSTSVQAPTAQALAAIERAETKDDIGDALVNFLAASFGCGLVMICKKTVLLGWRGVIGTADAETIEGLALPLSEPSMFRNAMHHRQLIRGPAPHAGRDLQQRFWKLLHCPPPAEVLVAPVVISHRVVNLLYTQSSPNGRLPAGLDAQVQMVCDAASRGLVEIIRRQRSP